MARITFEIEDEVKNNFALIALLQKKSMTDILKDFVQKQIKRNEKLLRSN